MNSKSIYALVTKSEWSPCKLFVVTLTNMDWF